MRSQKARRPARSGLRAPFTAGQGLSADQVAARYEHQRGLCAVCGRGFGARDMHRDHDHEFAREICGHAPERGCPACFRALLCGGCNVMLGAAGDDPEILARAVGFLRVSRARLDDAIRRRDGLTRHVPDPDVPEAG